MKSIFAMAAIIFIFSVSDVFAKPTNLSDSDKITTRTNINQNLSSKADTSAYPAGKNWSKVLSNEAPREKHAVSKKHICVGNSCRCGGF